MRIKDIKGRVGRNKNMEEEIIYFYNVKDGKYYQSRYTHRWLNNLQNQVQKQKEVIDRILNETKETRNILNNNRDDNMLSKSCLLSYLEIVEDLLKEVSK